MSSKIGSGNVAARSLRAANSAHPRSGSDRSRRWPRPRRESLRAGAALHAAGKAAGVTRAASQSGGPVRGAFFIAGDGIR